MEQAAEPVSPVHTTLISCDGGRTDPWIRRFQPEGPVGTVDVVVLDVGLKHLLEVSSPDDQQPIQALGSHRADPALGVGVGVGCLHRRDQHLGALRPKHVERAGELRVSVADEELQWPMLAHQQVAGLLGNPGAVRVGGHAGQVDPPGAHFDEEQHIQPVQPDRVHGEEVAGHDSGGLLAQSRPPGGGYPPGRGIQPVATQDGPDGSGGDLDAEALEFALDPLVAPARVLPGQAANQLLYLLVQRWSSGLMVRVGPGAGDQASVSSQQRLRPDEEAGPAGPGQDAADRSHQRPVGGLELRPWRLAA
jgi:hypothetical protein